MKMFRNKVDEGRIQTTLKFPHIILSRQNVLFFTATQYKVPTHFSRLSGPIFLISSHLATEFLFTEDSQSEERWLKVGGAKAGCLRQVT